MSDIAQWMTEDLAHGSKSIAGALGAYGRRVKNRYGMTTWPFEARWDHGKGEMTYMITNEAAAWVEDAAGMP